MALSILSSRAIIGEYYMHLEQNPGAKWIDALSMFFNSDQPMETYPWLGQSPAMREWIGGRHSKGLVANSVVIENLHFEATLEVSVDDLRRDKSGQVLVRIREMADRTNAHWAKLLSALILNAESTTCYDNQYFFDTDHSEGSSGTQSNKITVDISALPANQHGTTTQPSVEEMAQSALLGIQQMLSFKDDQGEPMNENASSFLLMTPVSLLQPAIAAIKNTVLTAGAINSLPNSGFSLDVVANPRLNWTDRFSIWRTDGNIKPLIRQQETDVQIKAKAEGSEYEFDYNMHQYGVDARRNVGYGFWQQAVEVIMG